MDYDTKQGLAITLMIFLPIIFLFLVMRWMDFIYDSYFCPEIQRRIDFYEEHKPFKSNAWYENYLDDLKLKERFC